MAIAAAAVSAVCGGVGPETPVPPQLITLQNGEVLRGTIKEVLPDVIILVHPILGEVRVPRSGVKSAEPALPSPPAPASNPPEAAQPPAEPPKPEPPKAEAPKAEAPKPEPAKSTEKPKEPEKPGLWDTLSRDDDKSFWDGWSHAAEFGGNVTAGNADTYSVRATLSLRRDSKNLTTALDGQYVYGRDNSGESRNHGEVRGRNDFKVGEANWQLWTAGTFEVDGITPWKYRLTASTGPAYTFFKDDKESLSARVGLGATREFDGGDNATIPNAVAALEYNRKFSAKTSLYANSEVYPSLREIDDTRTISRAGLMYLIDPETKATVRFGGEHRYSTSSGPREASDWDLFVVLGISF